MIVGDTFDYTEYKDMLCHSIKDDWRKHFTFYRSIPYHEMPEVYSLAAGTGGCLLSTSLHESAPMTFIEAMSCKCPVVSTDVGGVKELITNDVTIRLYSVGDIDGGIKAIIELVNPDKKSVRSKVVDHAAMEVATKHSIETVGQMYKELLVFLADRSDEGRLPRPFGKTLLTQR